MHIERSVLMIPNERVTQMSMVFDDALAHARHLDLPDRIRLAQVIWDEVADSTAGVRLPHDFCEELDRRIERHELHPEEATPWEVVRARIERRS